MHTLEPTLTDCCLDSPFVFYEVLSDGRGLAVDVRDAQTSLFASESDMICALFGSEVKDKYFKSKGAYGMVKLGYCKCPDFINMHSRPPSLPNNQSLPKRLTSTGEMLCGMLEEQIVIVDTTFQYSVVISSLNFYQIMMEDLLYSEIDGLRAVIQRIDPRFCRYHNWHGEKLLMKPFEYETFAAEVRRTNPKTVRELEQAKSNSCRV